MLQEIVLKNRSYRRFDGSFSIAESLLRDLVGLARICPSSRNQQALKFRLVHNPEEAGNVFKTLAWAGYLKEWGGPSEEERPSAYIVIAGDTTLGTKFDTDLGIVAQTILLGAAERELGGCMIASVQKEALRQLLKFPDYLEILMVIALGKPVETVVIEPVTDGNIRYWRSEDRVHHVPKRSLEDLLINP